MYILGTGLAGLIIGAIEPKAVLLETAAPKSHNALLRFRSPVIGDVLGIPFKKVRVYKSISNESNSPSVYDIISYSRKVSGSIGYRSICNLESEYRWIAPDNFTDQLLEICRSRIFPANLNQELLQRYYLSGEPIISTVPMSVMADVFNIEQNFQFQSKPIYVNTFIIPNCDVYTTIYCPDIRNPVYRISITGNKLIIESIAPLNEDLIDDAIITTGLQGMPINHIIADMPQNNGKMIPIDNKWRKEFIFKLTMEHNIYSVGRLATWKNIVLDEMYDDFLKVKKMIHNSKYDNYISIRSK